jgi:hypothetical protein
MNTHLLSPGNNFEINLKESGIEHGRVTNSFLQEIRAMHGEDFYRRLQGTLASR